MKKFKDIIEEITVFTVKNEDVPTTSVGNAPAGMVDEPIVKKKKDKKVTLIDGRTKAYRKHRQKLEAQRQTFKDTLDYAQHAIPTPRTLASWL